MQFCLSFFPNYPFSPISTRESIINEGLKIAEQSKIDQEWLKIWIKRKQEQKQLSSYHITLSDYRQKLIQHAHLLQQYENALKNYDNKTLFELRTKIEQSNHFIYDCSTIKNIQKQIRRRQSKRARFRRQKAKQPIKTNIIESKLTNEKSLMEKIHDIETILRTVEQLKYIRQQQNHTITNDDNELIDIQNMCNARLLEYIEMEKQIRLPYIELYNYLFNNHDRSFYESTDLDAQYFLRAHENKTNLVEIRRMWDQYLTTHFTSFDNIIPFKWYEPEIPCDSNWTRYIFNKKS